MRVPTPADLNDTTERFRRTASASYHADHRTLPERAFRARWVLVLIAVLMLLGLQLAGGAQTVDAAVKADASRAAADVRQQQKVERAMLLAEAAP